MRKIEIFEMLSEILTIVRELKTHVIRHGQVENPSNDNKLLFDFSNLKKHNVMMHFVEMYECFGVFGTKEQLQHFLTEQTNLGTRSSVHRLYNRCMNARLGKPDAG